jgi:hypothetical protein
MNLSSIKSLQIDVDHVPVFESMGSANEQQQQLDKVGMNLPDLFLN